MPNIPFTQQLSSEYKRLYKECIIKSSKFELVDRLCDNLLSHIDRYQYVSDILGIPWYFVAVIHNMESGQRFDRHLHNGDPLTKRTTHIPQNRPKEGNPPFTWEESAIDAMRYKGVDKVKSWTLSRTLYELEKYNGWGYRLYHPYVLSPYLWSWSNHYKSGKYTSDGRWSESAVSKQCGSAVLLRRLEEIGEIYISSTQMDMRQLESVDIEEDNKSSIYPIFKYSKAPLAYGKELQIFLNSFEGIVLRVDGILGDRTSEAVKKLFGFYLYGDSRNS